MEKQGLKFSILRVLVHLLQHWADSVSRYVGEEERSDLRNQANAERTDTRSVADAPRVLSSPAPVMGSADAENPPAHWLTRTSAGEPPAHWLARVQKGAPELLKQKGGTNRNVGTQSRTLSAARADDSAQKIDTWTLQRSRLTGTILTAEDARGLAETSTREERGPRRDEAHVPASPRNAATQSYMPPSAPTAGNMPAADAGAGQRDRVTEISWAKKDSNEPRKPGIDATLSPLRAWLSQPAQPGSSPWEERSGINANRQARYNLWSQVGMSKSAQGHEWPRVSETGEHIQVAMRWPSLPEEVTTGTQDWEMAWRAWERQQRLDEEQRGSSWNA